MPYNFVAESFYTKRLCSRLSCSEVRFYVLRPLWGLTGKVLWSTFFARCYGWGATSEYRFKIGDFAP